MHCRKAGDIQNTENITHISRKDFVGILRLHVLKECTEPNSPRQLQTSVRLVWFSCLERLKNFVLMPPFLFVPRPVESKVGCVNRAKDMSSGKWKSVSSTELAQSLNNVGASSNAAEFLIVDCRSLVAFNGLHIRGAIHVNCTGIGRKRLSQGKAKLKDLISSAEGKEKFISGGVGTTFVIYDELSSVPDDCNPCRPICLVLQTLLKEGKNISVLKGKFC